MAARPRIKQHKGLPPNLYPNIKNGVTYYRYRRPDDGSWFPMGKDRQEAIEAAKQLNSELMSGGDLVANVLGLNKNNSVTLASFIDYFKNEVIPEREWAKDTLDLFNIRIKQINNAIGDKPIDEVTIRDVSEFLDKLSPRVSNQAKSYLEDIFNYAVAKGLCPDNPASCTIKKKEKKRRKRHTVEGLKAVRDASPQWLKNAIDLALITAQRREEIVLIRFSDIKDGYLYVIQEKTKKKTDASWIRFKITPELQQVINSCKDDILSPFLIHRKPEVRKPSKDREHWTQILKGYLTKEFKKATVRAGCYAHYDDDECPTFHEIRALSTHLYKKQGKSAQGIAGHSKEETTKNYEKGHEDIIWSDAVPDLDISNII